MIGRIRFSARALSAALSTAGYWGAMEVERARAPEADKQATLVAWVPRWARRLCGLFGVDVTAEGLFVDHGDAYPAIGPNGVGRIFIMNHRSGMDIPVMLSLVEGHLVSRADLASWPFIGQGARRIGTMFVDRSSMRSGATVQKEMERGLEEGKGVAIFPEGTAFDGDEVRPFRPGAFRAALKTGAEIVPLGIAYDLPEAYYGDESFMEHMERVVGLPALHASVVIGAPITAKEGERVTDLRERAREAVQALVYRARERL